MHAIIHCINKEENRTHKVLKFLILLDSTFISFSLKPVGYAIRLLSNLDISLYSISYTSAGYREYAWKTLALTKRAVVSCKIIMVEVKQTCVNMQN